MQVKRMIAKSRILSRDRKKYDITDFSFFSIGFPPLSLSRLGTGVLGLFANPPSAKSCSSSSESLMASAMLLNFLLQPAISLVKGFQDFRSLVMLELRLLSRFILSQFTTQTILQWWLEYLMKRIKDILAFMMHLQINKYKKGCPLAKSFVQGS